MDESDAQSFHAVYERRRACASGVAGRQRAQCLGGRLDGAQQNRLAVGRVGRRREERLTELVVVANETMQGCDEHVVHALPHDDVRRLLGLA